MNKESWRLLFLALSGDGGGRSRNRGGRSGRGKFVKSAPHGETRPSITQEDLDLRRKIAHGEKVVSESILEKIRGKSR